MCECCEESPATHELHVSNLDGIGLASKKLCRSCILGMTTFDGIDVPE